MVCVGPSLRRYRKEHYNNNPTSRRAAGVCPHLCPPWLQSQNLNAVVQRNGHFLSPSFTAPSYLPLCLPPYRGCHTCLSRNVTLSLAKLRRGSFPIKIYIYNSHDFTSKGHGQSARPGLGVEADVHNHVIQIIFLDYEFTRYNQREW